MIGGQALVHFNSDGYSALAIVVRISPLDQCLWHVHVCVSSRVELKELVQQSELQFCVCSVVGPKLSLPGVRSESKMILPISTLRSAVISVLQAGPATSSYT